jgi:AcrR family transcriptional regulator
MSRANLIPILWHIFQQYGYDGASLAKISEATGLGKASLYHHFPGGKDEMMAVVMVAIAQRLEQGVLASLRSEQDVHRGLTQMCRAVGQYYEGGDRPCLLAILLAGSVRDQFHQQVQGLIGVWIEAIAEVLVRSGLDSLVARHRAEDALITIQGALIVSQGLGDKTIFQRAIAALPDRLCPR